VMQEHRSLRPTRGGELYGRMRCIQKSPPRRSHTPDKTTTAPSTFRTTSEGSHRGGGVADITLFIAHPI
jgi:hypothetical protein